MVEHQLKKLTTTVHKLRAQLNRNGRQNNSSDRDRLYARGYLVGEFLFNNILQSSDLLVFTGDFRGFFQQNNSIDSKKSVYEHWQEIQFEGTIQNMSVVSINGSIVDLVQEMDDNTFRGYFKGIIRLHNPQIEISDEKTYSVNQLLEQNLIEVQYHEQILIPTFVRFTLKNINSIDFETSSAKVSGTMNIDIQLNDKLIRSLQNDASSQKTLCINLARQMSIELPIKTETGRKLQSDYSINYHYEKSKQTISYVIRKTFQACIDNTHGQFYAPFNLIYLRIVLKFSESHIPRRILNKNKSLSYRSDYNETSHLKFVCYDLDDTLTDNNPFSSYNELARLEDKDKDKLRNKITKINYLTEMYCGDYIVSSNNLALFPYYKDTLGNTNKRSTSFMWNLGIQERHTDFKDPAVKSVDEQFELKFKESQDKSKRNAKLFQFKCWNRIYIKIPIYRYWMIYFIQIFIPLIILATLSMYIFLQENGYKTDGYSTINQRIANATALLIAYGAMIPVLRENTAHSTFFSFFQLVIYLSIVPLIVVLVGSVVDSYLMNLQWRMNYHPFEDVFFLIAFYYVCALLLVVFIVLFIAIKFSKDRQIDTNHAQLNFKNFNEASQPQGFKRFLKNIKIKRDGQYTVSRYED